MPLISSNVADAVAHLIGWNTDTVILIALVAGLSGLGVSSAHCWVSERIRLLCLLLRVCAHVPRSFGVWVGGGVVVCVV